MIAGTTFHFVEFDRVWAKVKQRAQQHIAPADIENASQQEAAGTAVCLMCDEGIMVLSVTPDLQSDGTIAFVILVVSTGRPGAFKRHEGDMLEIARDIGVARIAFRTDRCRAWARLLGPEWCCIGDRFERGVP